MDNTPHIRLHAYTYKQEPMTEALVLPREEHADEYGFAPAAHFLLLSALFVAVFTSVIFFSYYINDTFFSGHLPKNYMASIMGISDVQEATTTEETIPVKVILYKDPFKNVVIEGKSAYVFDMVSGKALYKKNETIQMPLASITKVMTAIVVADIVDDETTISVSQNDLLLDEIQDIVAGETWRMKDLLDFTLVTSSNNGSSVLASVAGRNYAKKFSSDMTVPPKEIFIERMNEKAKTIGMTSTVFYNESGLDVTSTKSGGYGSASDVASLYQFILANKPTLLEATRVSSMDIVSTDTTVRHAKNTNQMVGSFPGIMASKTGSTDLAGGNLSIVFDSGIGTPIIVVVLGSSAEGRFKDVAILSRAAREAVAQGAF